ncbi:hypothetical protein EV401DRAFT_1891871 [Pisolithus croceorrhizus]|nr:hypothetical protein EV401DRAFT_1891871 [Pisolithus croceorrhizus]
MPEKAKEVLGPSTCEVLCFQNGTVRGDVLQKHNRVQIRDNNPNSPPLPPNQELIILDGESTHVDPKGKYSVLMDHSYLKYTIYFFDWIKWKALSKTLTHSVLIIHYGMFLDYCLIMVITYMLSTTFVARMGVLTYPH